MAVLLETTLGDLVIDLYTEERPRGTGRRCDGGRGRGAPAAWARPGPAASGLGGAAGRRRYPRGGWKRGAGGCLPRGWGQAEPLEHPLTAVRTVSTSPSGKRLCGFLQLA